MRITSLFGRIIFLSNILNAIKIEKLIVPDVVQIGNVSDIILDCQFSMVTDEKLEVRWFYNGSKMPVYHWKPRASPIDNGILNGRLDLTFRVSLSTHDEGRALRIIRLGPDLSGEYTCSVEWNGTDVHQTKAMLVFSPEQEFNLEVKRVAINYMYEYNVTCTARGLYPPPDLILEFKNEVIQKQQQRIWRNGEIPLYDTQSSARFAIDCHGTFICRLVIPEAGYSSITEKTVYSSDHCRNLAAAKKLSNIYICAAFLRYALKFNTF